MVELVERKNAAGDCHCVDVDPVTGLMLPAVTGADGTKVWYVNGKQHRTDIDPKTGLALPAETWPHRFEAWWVDGKQHRTDVDPKTGLALPAEIWSSGSKNWWVNDKLHRTDADPETGLTLPAVILKDGSKCWFVGGKWHRTDGFAWRRWYWWEGEKVTRESIVERVTVVPWVVWTSRGVSQAKRLPGAVLDEVVELAMPQMAAS